MFFLLKNRYATVSPEELAAFDDDCAICRERMQSAKKLPCGHIFHLSCLRSWLQQHHSCPTCRSSLIHSNNQQGENANNAQEAGAQRPNNGTLFRITSMFVF
jgi:autocrine motility factor receptor